MLNESVDDFHSRVVRRSHRSTIHPLFRALEDDDGAESSLREISSFEPPHAITDGQMLEYVSRSLDEFEQLEAELQVKEDYRNQHVASAPAATAQQASQPPLLYTEQSEAEAVLQDLKKIQDTIEGYRHGRDIASAAEFGKENGGATRKEEKRATFVEAEGLPASQRLPLTEIDPREVKALLKFSLGQPAMRRMAMEVQQQRQRTKRQEEPHKVQASHTTVSGSIASRSSTHKTKEEETVSIRTTALNGAVPPLASSPPLPTKEPIPPVATAAAAAEEWGALSKSIATQQATLQAALLAQQTKMEDALREQQAALRREQEAHFAQLRKENTRAMQNQQTTLLRGVQNAVQQQAAATAVGGGMRPNRVGPETVITATTQPLSSYAASAHRGDDDSRVEGRSKHTGIVDYEAVQRALETERTKMADERKRWGEMLLTQQARHAEELRQAANRAFLQQQASTAQATTVALSKADQLHAQHMIEFQKKVTRQQQLQLEALRDIKRGGAGATSGGPKPQSHAQASPYAAVTVPQQQPKKKAEKATTTHHHSSQPNGTPTTATVAGSPYDAGTTPMQRRRVNSIGTSPLAPHRSTTSTVAAASSSMTTISRQAPEEEEEQLSLAAGGEDLLLPIVTPSFVEQTTNALQELDRSHFAPPSRRAQQQPLPTSRDAILIVTPPPLPSSVSAVGGGGRPPSFDAEEEPRKGLSTVEQCVELFRQEKKNNNKDSDKKEGERKGVAFQISQDADEGSRFLTREEALIRRDARMRLAKLRSFSLPRPDDTIPSVLGEDAEQRLFPALTAGLLHEVFAAHCRQLPNNEKEENGTESLSEVGRGVAPIDDSLKRLLIEDVLWETVMEAATDTAAMSKSPAREVGPVAAVGTQEEEKDRLMQQVRQLILEEVLGEATTSSRRDGLENGDDAVKLVQSVPLSGPLGRDYHLTTDALHGERSNGGKETTAQASPPAAPPTSVQVSVDTAAMAAVMQTFADRLLLVVANHHNQSGTGLLDANAVSATVTGPRKSSSVMQRESPRRGSPESDVLRFPAASQTDASTSMTAEPSTTSPPPPPPDAAPPSVNTTATATAAVIEHLAALLAERPQRISHKDERSLLSPSSSSSTSSSSSDDSSDSGGVAATSTTEAAVAGVAQRAVWAEMSRWEWVRRMQEGQQEEEVARLQLLQEAAQTLHEVHWQFVAQLSRKQQQQQQQQPVPPVHATTTSSSDPVTALILDWFRTQQPPMAAAAPPTALALSPPRRDAALSDVSTEWWSSTHPSSLDINGAHRYAVGCRFVEKEERTGRRRHDDDNTTISDVATTLTSLTSHNPTTVTSDGMGVGDAHDHPYPPNPRAALMNASVATTMTTLFDDD